MIRGAKMQRWTVALLGVLLLAFIGTLVMNAGPKKNTTVSTPDAGAPQVQEGGGSSKAPEAGSASPDAAPGTQEAGPVADLPDDAPKHVSFGVILFTYRGAQGAPETARTKAEALALAKSVLPEAIDSFDEAVKKGDRGSRADAGRIPRGVLERGIEYVLFTLDAGAVYPEPLDTPRGIWILRRIK